MKRFLVVSSLLWKSWTIQLQTAHHYKSYAHISYRPLVVFFQTCNLVVLFLVYVFRWSSEVIICDFIFKYDVLFSRYFDTKVSLLQLEREVFVCQLGALRKLPCRGITLVLCIHDGGRCANAITVHTKFQPVQSYCGLRLWESDCQYNRQLAKLLSGNEVRGKVAISAMQKAVNRCSLVRYRHGLEKFLEHHFIPIRRRFKAGPPPPLRLF